jgi:hypothetical protein
MKNLSRSVTDKIDKKQVATIAIFAMNNIQGVDEFTLKKFLELMNTTGAFGSITVEQLIEVVRLTMKYIPGSCVHSLDVLIEILNAQLSLPLKSSDDLISQRC